MNKWTAEITNDPERDFELYLELLCDGEYVARIQRNSSGEFELSVYGERELSIPLAWLQQMSDRAKTELP